MLCDNLDGWDGEWEGGSRESGFMYTYGWFCPYGRKWRGIKEPFDEGEQESEKAGLKLNIQKTEIMASGPITAWHIDGETMETVKDFIFLGLTITADSDCSHEIKRCLLFEKSYDKPRQHNKKQRHYFANKGLSSQSYGFSSGHVWSTQELMKAEHQRIDFFFF